MNKHKDLAEAFGICWHETKPYGDRMDLSGFCVHCDKEFEYCVGVPDEELNPDFTEQIELPCDACGGTGNKHVHCADMIEQCEECGPMTGCKDGKKPIICPDCNGRMTRLITRVQVEAEKDGTWERFAEHLWSKTHSEKYCDKPLSTYDIYKILTDANALVDEYHKWRMGGNDETN